MTDEPDSSETGCFLIVGACGLGYALYGWAGLFGGVLAFGLLQVAVQILNGLWRRF